jgi:outer membrane immunogenic protein
MIFRATLFLTAVAAIAGIGSASAADMAVKARPLAVEPGYNWSGFYIGGNIGAIASSGRSVHQCINPAGVFGGPLCDIIPDTNLDGTGVLGGVQAGYNWQAGRWVFGIEGDGQGTSLKSSSTIGGAFPLTGGGGLTDPATTMFTNSARLNWLATARGRVGVTSGAALFYVTGGGAFGGVQTATNLFAPGLNGYPSTTDTTRAGWTAGGGIEWGFAPRWSAKLEGLYYDLGRVTSLGTSVPLITAYREGSRLEINGWIARIGVNYHFAGPVVAKY